ncbi:DMT family transporter [Leisingera methylohalidivorans]|uniref:DMT family transporter n=1 Tax=Leisingera methylohalidivorans TaxID=133924 RepID=UPI00146FA4C3|nr:DMT family transporter [Leisingera methylohalidivorans]
MILNVNKRKPSLAVGLISALAVVVIFCSLIISSRIGVANHLSPYDLAAIRFGVGGIILLPFFFKYGLGGLTATKVLSLVLFGGIGFAVLAYGGLNLAPAAHGTTVMQGTLPLFSFIVALWMRESVGSRTTYLGALVICLGVVVMLADSLNQTDERQLLGDALLLLASFSWAVYAFRVQKLRIAAPVAVGVIGFFSLIAYIPLYLFINGISRIALTPLDALFFQVLFQGVIVGAFTILAYTRAVETFGALGTAMFVAIVPLLTTCVGVLLLKEIPSTAGWVGVSIVPAGMLIVVWSRRHELVR